MMERIITFSAPRSLRTRSAKVILLSMRRYTKAHITAHLFPRCSASGRKGTSSFLILMYGKNALAVFIQPPSVEELRNRLVGRGTDAPEAIERRVAKAEEELTYADKFDVVLINDQLEEALATAEKIVGEFAAR